MLNITYALNIFKKTSYITYSPLGEGSQYATFDEMKEINQIWKKRHPRFKEKNTFQAPKVRY